MKRTIGCLQTFLLLLLLVACDDGRRERLQLEELERQNRADSLMTNDSLALALTNYFDRHGTPNEQLRAYYILGRTYADRNELPQAVATYKDAADRADTTAQDCDYHTLSRVHAQLANIYYSQLLPENMIREQKLAMKYADMSKDTMAYLACYVMLAEGYDMKNLKDSALYCLQDAYLLYNQIGAVQLASALCCSMADIYRQRRDYAQAQDYMLEYEKQSGFFDEDGNVELGKEIYYSCKGQLCLDTSDKDKAEFFFRKLLGVVNNYNLKIAALDGLQRFYAKYHNRDSLVKYDHLSDSICSIAHNEVEMQKTLQVQSMYDYTRSEQKANQKSREADRLLNTLIMVMSLSFVIISLFTIAYIRHQNARKLLESKYRAEMEKLAQAQVDLFALRSEQSVSKNLLCQKEQEILTLQEASQHYRKKIHTLQGYALNERLLQAPVTIRLQKYLRQNPYKLPTHEDWRDLKILINHEIPSFYNTLNVDGNNLNDFEYDVCILIRLQFIPTNIAKFKKCSPSYITQIRKSIFEKLFHRKGSAEELDQYVLSLN